MGPRGKFASLVLLAMAALAVVWRLGHLLPWPASEPPLAYAGNSEELRATLVVPTLDTPIDPAQNAICCASFQLAWNALKAETNTPVLPIQNAEEVSARLCQFQEDTPGSKKKAPEEDRPEPHTVDAASPRVQAKE